MARLGLILIHDKGDTNNAAQITRVLSGVTRYVPTGPDDDQTPKYRFAARTFDIVVLQIVPPGVTLPANFYSIAHVSAILYSAADNPCTTGQFFQAAVVRAIKNWACDYVAVVDDYTGLTRANVDAAIAKMVTGSVFLESEAIGRCATKQFLVSLRHLFNDGMTYAELVSAYRAEIDRLGLARG